MMQPVPVDDLYGNTTNYSGYPYFWNVQPIEKNHDFAEVRQWWKRNWYLSIYISIIYLGLVYALHRYMKHRPAVDIRLPFLWWNVALAIFSTCGMCRSMPELLFIVVNYGMEFSMCNSTVNSVTGFWITAFALSKAVELVDTVFLVLRKRLTFLHLVHHVLTLMITWFFTMDAPALFRWSYTLNFTVHSFMYTYFALKSMKVHVPEFVSFCITSVQIIQFVIGFVTSVHCFILILNGTKCNSSMGVAITTISFNVFFFYIFGKFFVNRYLRTGTKTKRD